MTFTTVTPGRIRSLRPQLNREATRWVPRPHRRPTPHQSTPVHFVQIVVVDDSLYRLNPLGISGEMPTPPGTGACDMRSTGTERDAAFAYPLPRSTFCAGQPPDDDEPRRTDHGHLTITGKISPAPTASLDFHRRGYPTVSHSLSEPSPTVERQKISGWRWRRSSQLQLNLKSRLAQA